jgi:putative transposase
VVYAWQRNNHCERLKVPAKQQKRGRLWLADGSCFRLRAERPNHVWSYDFVEDRTHERRKYSMLNGIDELARSPTMAAVASTIRNRLAAGGYGEGYGS